MTPVDFPIGFIVSINGYDLDYGKFKQKNVPMLYRVVDDPTGLPNDHNSSKLKNDKLIVTCVTSGEYEWYNKNVLNDLVSNYK